MNVTIGADPELFVSQDGQIVSGFGLIEGTKENPFPVENGAVQVDGMALEFNINPADHDQAFVDNINSVLDQLRGMVPDHQLEIIAVAEFTKEYMKQQPKEAVVLGCDPDFSAYTGRPNNPPNAAADFRTAAGHVHIGWTEDAKGEEHFSKCVGLTRQLDLFLGIPSLLFDDCVKRRELYGKAGAFRPKPYGVEYRVLSNKWLENEDLMKFVFKYATHAHDLFEQGEFPFTEFEDVRQTIDNNDTERAKQIVDQLGIEVH